MWCPNLTLSQTSLIMHKQDIFLLPLYRPLQLPKIKPPNLPPSFQHIHNLHLKSLGPHVGANLPVEGQLIINIPIRHSIQLIQTLVTILTQYLPLFSFRLHQIRPRFCHWMYSTPLIKNFIVFDYITTSLAFNGVMYKWCFIFHWIS